MPVIVESLSATQFAWSVLRRGDYRPPKPVAGDRCWLCGGATGGDGWPLTALPDTFANHNLARVQHSPCICDACMALGSKPPWEAYVADHPEMGLKTGHAVSWRFYSHLFWAGGHRCPTRPEWRVILVEPPDPPFVAAITTSGQKHLLFRASIAQSAERFPVQFEERALVIRSGVIVDAISAVEGILAAGARRDEIAEGAYASDTWRRVGIAPLRRAEAAAAVLRRTAPDEWALAIHVARGRVRPQSEKEAPRDLGL